MMDITTLNPDYEYLLIRPKHDAGYSVSNEEIQADCMKWNIRVVWIINDPKVTCWQFVALPPVVIPEDTERPRGEGVE